MLRLDMALEGLCLRHTGNPLTNLTNYEGIFNIGELFVACASRVSQTWDPGYRAGCHHDTA